MSKLNRDVLYLILEELLCDHNTLYPYSVNKTWCEIIIPILWKNPWKHLKKGKEELLLKVILSHLSDESKNGLKVKTFVFWQTRIRDLCLTTLVYFANI